MFALGVMAGDDEDIEPIVKMSDEAMSSNMLTIIARALNQECIKREGQKTALRPDCEAVVEDGTLLVYDHGSTTPNPILLCREGGLTLETLRTIAEELYETELLRPGLRLYATDHRS